MAYEKTLALFGTIILFNLVAFLPLLLFSSLRRLFNILSSKNLLLNYVLGVGVFSVLHSLSLLAAVIATGGLEGTEALWGLGLVTAATGILTWATIVFLFPRKGIWDLKQKDEVDGRIALSLGLIWYYISTAIGLFLLMAFLIAFFFPG